MDRKIHVKPLGHAGLRLPLLSTQVNPRDEKNAGGTYLGWRGGLEYL